MNNQSEYGIISGNELQLTAYESTPITAWDFDAIKAELARAVSVFASTVYTDESIKSAKEDKARLKKVKDVFEGARKEYKKQCMAPYEAVESKVKELTSLLDRQIAAVDAAVKDYDARMKEEKAKSVKAFYDKKSAPLGEMADQLYDTIFDPKWLNASTPKSRYEAEILGKINTALQNVAAIKALNSPYQDTLLDLYAQTGSTEAVKEKESELRETVARAGISVAAPSAPEQETMNRAEGETLLALKVSPWQLAKVKDFLTALGIEFEVR